MKTADLKARAETLLRYSRDNVSILEALQRDLDRLGEIEPSVQTITELALVLSVMVVFNNNFSDVVNDIAAELTADLLVKES